jgi:hypothetical protein
VKLTPARLRVLELLESKPLHRHDLGFAFARKRRKAMSTQAATRLAGYLCRPLVEAGLITEICDRDGWHQEYRITLTGVRALLGHPWRAAGMAGLMDRALEEYSKVRDLLPPVWRLDENHQPVRCTTWREYAEWMGTSGHHVGFDQVGDPPVTVSTVFLMSSGSLFFPIPPFETMIFGGPHDRWQHRWRSWDEAVKGHRAALALVRTGFHLTLVH